MTNPTPRRGASPTQGCPQGTPLHRAPHAPPLLDSRLRGNDGVVTRAPFAVAAGARTLIGGGAASADSVGGLPGRGGVRRSGVASLGSFWRTFSHPGRAVHTCAARRQRRCGEDNGGRRLKPVAALVVRQAHHEWLWMAGSRASWPSLVEGEGPGVATWKVILVGTQGAHKGRPYTRHGAPHPFWIPACAGMTGPSPPSLPSPVEGEGIW